jgi:chorismate dehydratase
METTRIAVVRYLNTAPLIEGLRKLSGVELIPAAPSAIADLVDSGQADLGLASLIDAVRLGLSILPGGMIGCDGPTLTVRLYSAVPLQEISRLHADAESHTSVVLSQVLLDRLHGVRPTIVEFEAREASADFSRWPESVLLIGDKVVVHAPPRSRYPHQLDLGEAWKSLTGKPFVYAAWMTRSDRADEPRIRVASLLLDRQRRHNATRLEWIAARHAPAHAWPIDLARHYLIGLLRYDLGAVERDGAERFIDEAARLGLCPSARPSWLGAYAPVAAAC